jgi:hypothetical protein
VRDLEFTVVDIYLMPVKKKEFLPKIPIIGKYFVHVVQASLSKSDASPERMKTEGIAREHESCESQLSLDGLLLARRDDYQ